MTKLDCLHVSVFTSTPGRGNPAGVCQLEEWPSTDLLSEIARKVALPVTSFVVAVADGLELRWLTKSGTPVKSICGHGSFAAAYAVSETRPDLEAFAFKTPGGAIVVQREAGLFRLRLPRWDAEPMSEWPDLVKALRASRPPEIFDAGRDVLAVFGSEAEVRDLSPDMEALLKLGHRGFVATAPGDAFDCVSRFFCPSFGIGADEDPITGSAHCAIAPFWSKQLGRPRIHAYQASAEGGELHCEVHDNSVTIGASAVRWRHTSVIL
jgi:PhzF family phenazine biosynthesis protein